ncbi:MAG: single-stranded-DNA-specific exonuclease RecJ [Anaerolineae bacterium]
MKLWRKRWRIAPPAPPGLFRRFSLRPLVAQVLYNRGLTEPGAVQVFLEGRVEADAPFRLCDVEPAVTLIRRFVRQGQPLAVYGDYDADGITALALLAQVLEALGARVFPYIPDREDEGYGLNREAIHGLYRRGTRLLLTVDCGIRSLEEVALARKLGMAVVVTDHHHVGEALPRAEAVINPRRSDNVYPFKDFAGVGVAFKLAQGLLRVNARSPLPTTREDLRETELLDLVALGTVADMVPLLGENHALVRRGLEVLNAARRPGVAALLETLELEPGDVKASTIGYVLAPRLNAAGRLGDPLTAFRLLMASDVREALSIAAELEALNRQRQELTRYVEERARTLVLEADGDAPILFAVGSDFPSGIVGLAAGRLAEEFYRPAVVVEKGKTYSKASARSIPEFHITEALDEVGDLLEQYGGHAAAAGFTVRTERLPQVRERLLALAAERLADVQLRPSLFIDAEVPLYTLSWDDYEALENLAPFGYGNPRPVLVSRGLFVRHARVVGSEGQHLKLYVEDRSGKVWDAIAFRQAHWAERLPELVDLAYHLERNEWKGRVTLQLNVQDIHPSER